MNRRTFLATAGVGLACGLAGCSGGGGTPSGRADTDSLGEDGDAVSAAGSAPFEHPGTLSTTFVANGAYPTDGNPADGVPPAVADQPPRPDADPSAFDTLSANGETVRLAPIDVVVQWYRRGEARIVDARGLDQYRRAHVYGAVNSPAQRNSAGGGIEGWPQGARLVTYCGCPHHLSSIRAAGLQKAGFTDVYALDEGFVGWEDSWADRAYPMAGTAFRSGAQASLTRWTISGSVASRHAGAYVWASVGRQSEAAPVQPDGSYQLHLNFAGVSPESTVRIRTPTGAVERSLGSVGTRA